LIAVLLVFGAHIYPCPPEVNAILHTLTTLWKQGGYIGVDMFFVLSGFLVSGLLYREYQKTEAVNIPRFLARRALKLYPSLWVLTIAGAYLYAPVEPRQLIGELLFLQNYVGNLWLHTWSLAVEEHFYLLLSGFTAFWVARATPQRNPFRHIPLLFALIAIGCFLLRLMIGLTIEFDVYVHRFPTHMRLDGLMFGALMGYWWHFRGLAEAQWWRRWRYGLVVAGSLLLFPAFLFPEHLPWLNIVGYNFFSLGSAALLLGFLAFDFQPSAIARFLGRLGSYSYSIYLWHLPVEIITRTIMEPRGWLAGSGWYGYAAFYIIGSILWGIALYILVELPFMRLRDRWFPSRVAALSSSG
jgi:peptidoglycan/LPS O-acetylase OafA/YrhL